MRYPQTTTFYTDHWPERRDVYELLRKWEANTNDQVSRLADLIGYADRKFNEKDVAILKKLAGPHGYTIYKMLLARKGTSDRSYSSKEMMEARVVAHEKLCNWGVVDDSMTTTYFLLKKLLGIDVNAEFVEWKNCMTDEQVWTCHLLAGPNGFTVYRMLMARIES